MQLAQLRARPPLRVAHLKLVVQLVEARSLVGCCCHQYRRPQSPRLSWREQPSSLSLLLASR